MRSFVVGFCLFAGTVAGQCPSGWTSAGTGCTKAAPPGGFLKEQTFYTPAVAFQCSNGGALQTSGTFQNWCLFATLSPNHQVKRGGFSPNVTILEPSTTSTCTQKKLVGNGNWLTVQVPAELSGTPFARKMHCPVIQYSAGAMASVRIDGNLVHIPAVGSCANSQTWDGTGCVNYNSSKCFNNSATATQWSFAPKQDSAIPGTVWGQARVRTTQSALYQFDNTARVTVAAAAYYVVEVRHLSGVPLASMQVFLNSITTKIDGKFVKSETLGLNAGMNDISVHGFTAPMADGQTSWYTVSVRPLTGATAIASESFYVKRWENSNVAMPGELHSLSISPGGVKGGNHGSDPTLTINLDAPANPSGQRVFLAAKPAELGTILSPGYFDIPGCELSGSTRSFLTTKNTITNRTLEITATVNALTGYGQLQVQR